MFQELSEGQKHALWSFVELLCGYFRQKRSNLPTDPDRSWFVENRQRVHLPNVPGPEEKFVEWFDLLEKGNEGVWARFLGDLSDAGVSSRMYEEVKHYSPLAGKLIVARRGFNGKVHLSEQEARALAKNVFPVDHGDTFLVLSIDLRLVVYPFIYP